MSGFKSKEEFSEELKQLMEFEFNHSDGDDETRERYERMQ